MKKIVLFAILTLGVSNLKAQVDKNNPIIRKQLELVELMDEIADKVRVNDLLYKRIALVSFDYPDYIINETEAIQIRSRIEGAFVLGGFTIISAPEFKQKPLTIVNGTDSNLTITRQNTLERLILDEEKMNLVIDKYALQALMYVQLTYDHLTGYQVNLQLVKSRSKELIYSTIINSNPQLYNPRKAQFSVTGGLAFHNTQSYLVNNVDISKGRNITTTIADLSVSWRQSVNKNQSGFYGVNTGISFLNLLTSGTDTGVVNFSRLLPHVGLFYTIAFIKKNEQPRKYWLEAFQSMNVYVANSITTPYARQGIIFNATQNLSIEADFRYFMLIKEFAKENSILQLQQFGYGISLIYRP
jgi:hypothetical protein